MFSVLILQNPAINDTIWVFNCIQLVVITPAIVMQFRAWKHGLYELKYYHLTAFVLAAFYFIAFSILNFTTIDPIDWTRILRQLALLVWPIVWFYPAAISLRMRQREEKKADRICLSRDFLEDLENGTITNVVKSYEKNKLETFVKDS